MAITATLTSVTLEGSVIVLQVTFQAGVQSLVKAFRYDVQAKDLTLDYILQQIDSVKIRLEEKTVLFQQLKAKEGQAL